MFYFFVLSVMIFDSNAFHQLETHRLGRVGLESTCALLKHISLRLHTILVPLFDHCAS